MVGDWNWQMVRGRGWKLAENWELELVGGPEQEQEQDPERTGIGSLIGVWIRAKILYRIFIRRGRIYSGKRLNYNRSTGAAKC